MEHTVYDPLHRWWGPIPVFNACLYRGELTTVIICHLYVWSVQNFLQEWRSRLEEYFVVNVDIILTTWRHTPNSRQPIISLPTKGFPSGVHSILHDKARTARFEAASQDSIHWSLSKSRFHLLIWMRSAIIKWLVGIDHLPPCYFGVKWQGRWQESDI